MRKAELLTTGLRDPNQVDPITPIEALYSDGSNFSEVTPDPEPTSVKAVASAEEVRIYRINPDGKRFTSSQSRPTPPKPIPSAKRMPTPLDASLKGTMRYPAVFFSLRTRLNVRPIRRFPIRSKLLEKQLPISPV